MQVIACRLLLTRMGLLLLITLMINSGRRSRCATRPRQLMKHMNLKPVTTLILAILFLGSASVPALELSGRKVVIDPGHGGSDPGALGYNGSAWPDEADFNLTVSLKVRDLLQAAGCSVVMTRSTDVAVAV